MRTGEKWAIVSVILLAAASMAINVALWIDLGLREGRVAQLEAADLGGEATLSWTGSSFTFAGIVANHGTRSAHGVSVKIHLYEEETEVFEEEIYVGRLAGRKIDSVQTNFTFHGSWDDWGWTITES